MSLLQGTVGLSAVCDCGISRSYSVTVCNDVATLNEDSLKYSAVHF